MRKPKLSVKSCWAQTKVGWKPKLDDKGGAEVAGGECSARESKCKGQGSDQGTVCGANLYLQKKIQQLKNLNFSINKCLILNVS